MYVIIDITSSQDNLDLFLSVDTRTLWGRARPLFPRVSGLTTTASPSWVLRTAHLRSTRHPPTAAKMCTSGDCVPMRSLSWSSNLQLRCVMGQSVATSQAEHKFAALQSATKVHFFSTPPHPTIHSLRRQSSRSKRMRPWRRQRLRLQRRRCKTTIRIR